MSDTDRSLVLVVDDEPGVRLVVTGMLSQLGYHAIEAPDAEAALALIDREAVEVVITDLMMPQHDGLWLLDAIHKTYPYIPVILLTAHGTLEVAVDAIRRGAFDFMTKPLDREALIVTVQKAVAVSDRQFASGHRVDLVAESPQMRQVVALCKRMARSEAPVLVTGPSGSGKEVVARLLHGLRGEERPFIAVNCAAIPESLLESELFGHVRGAFTGATCDKPGRVELAQGGTLFLDEIGDLPAAIQVKLLRLVQEKTYERVGGVATKTADIRIVAATHRDLPDMVQRGAFREDLFFRLNVLPVYIPPLRERPQDIGPLAKRFLDRAARVGDRPAPTLTAEALDHLASLPWPGNARELGNLMERAAVLIDTLAIDVGEIETLRQLDAARPRPGQVVSEGEPEDERARLVVALARAGGKRTLAAKLLGVSRRTLYNKLERYQL